MSHRKKRGHLEAAIKAARRRARKAPGIEVGAIAADVLQARRDDLSDAELDHLEACGRAVLAGAGRPLRPYSTATAIDLEAATSEDLQLLGLIGLSRQKRRTQGVPKARIFGDGAGKVQP